MQSGLPVLGPNLQGTWHFIASMIYDRRPQGPWWLLITRVTITSSCHPVHIPSSAWQESRNIPWGLQHFLFYNNRPYLFRGSMNSLNVKVIHTGGTDPTLLIEKLRGSRSPMKWSEVYLLDDQAVGVYLRLTQACTQPAGLQGERKRRIYCNGRLSITLNISSHFGSPEWRRGVF